MLPQRVQEAGRIGEPLVDAARPDHVLLVVAAAEVGLGLDHLEHLLAQGRLLGDEVDQVSAVQRKQAGVGVVLVLPTGDGGGGQFRDDEHVLTEEKVHVSAKVGGRGFG